MANLIPPDAKKAIIIEYWIRVVVLWCILGAIGLVVVALLKFPTLLLIQNNMGNFSEAYNDAQEKKTAFEAAQIVITETNEVSQLLATSDESQAFSSYMAVIDGLAGTAVRIESFTLQRGDGPLNDITVTGVADTRAALADFSNDIEAHEWFTEAELPISNLAKDSDIAFNISITPNAEIE